MEYGGPGVASAVAYTAETGWIPLPPLPHATEEATACVLDGKLYVAGGGGCGKLQVWDGAFWTCKADLPTPRRLSAAIIVHDGKLIPMGGYIDDVEGEYDAEA